MPLEYPYLSSERYSRRGCLCPDCTWQHIQVPTLLFSALWTLEAEGRNNMFASTPEDHTTVHRVVKETRGSGKLLQKPRQDEASLGWRQREETGECRRYMGCKLHRTGHLFGQGTKVRTGWQGPLLTCCHQQPTVWSLLWLWLFFFFF